MLSSLLLAQAAPSVLDSVEQPFFNAGFDWQHFIAQVLVFAIVAFVLQKFAYGPVMSILEQRRKLIADSLTNAEKVKLELQKAEASRLEIIKKANEQGTTLIADAVKTAQQQGELEKQKATAQAEDILKKARAAALLERDQLLTELKAQVASLVIETTQKVSGKVLTSEDQTRLNSETQRQIAAQN